ncbi:MAG: hypothetical protein O9345_03220 [Burkholderiaceae bacterium]|jgi:hypothetical protein|nr:hypothetical protein [Burkholderiales bacterium]MCZ8107416.1 hypothetical protein [Burkholderiales bacterium]MCZ8337157.1 hypothetical protein [Burkholderiaceae bacterium]
MSAERERLEQRKALLVARSELERMQLALTVHRLRERVAPDARKGAEDGASRPARIAAAIVAVGVPLLGRRQLGRLLRGASIAMTAARVVRNWRG